MKSFESMACPKCSKTKSRVVNKRNYYERIYRRRECQICGSRWTTYEATKDRARL